MKLWEMVAKPRYSWLGLVVVLLAYGLYHGLVDDVGTGMAFLVSLGVYVVLTVVLSVVEAFVEARMERRRHDGQSDHPQR